MESNLHAPTSTAGPGIVRDIDSENCHAPKRFNYTPNGGMRDPRADHLGRATADRVVPD